MHIMQSGQQRHIIKKNIRYGIDILSLNILKLCCNRISVIVIDFEIESN